MLVRRVLKRMPNEQKVGDSLLKNERGLGRRVWNEYHNIALWGRRCTLRWVVSRDEKNGRSVFRPTRVFCVEEPKVGVFGQGTTETMHGHFSVYKLGKSSSSEGGLTVRHLTLLGKIQRILSCFCRNTFRGRSWHCYGKAGLNFRAVHSTTRWVGREYNYFTLIPQPKTFHSQVH